MFTSLQALRDSKDMQQIRAPSECWIPLLHLRVRHGMQVSRACAMHAAHLQDAGSMQELICAGAGGCDVLVLVL